MKAPDTTKLKDDLAAVRGDVKALRDEIKLKAHLARMDLKSDWKKLQPEIDRALSDVGADAVKFAKEVKERLLAIQKDLKKS